MGKVWGLDAVAKNASTSFYGNIVSLAESPMKEGLLYVGTDDGLVQVSEDGGKTWRRRTTFPGVPDMTYVCDLFASRSTRTSSTPPSTTTSRATSSRTSCGAATAAAPGRPSPATCPARGSAWTIAEDTVERDLLFAGTEFGVFFSRDGGKKWVQLKGGLPTIAVRDLAIQKREDDLVLATFGRGFYVLDDLRRCASRSPDLDKEALTFPVKRALAYIPSTPFGLRRRRSTARRSSPPPTRPSARSSPTT